MDDAARPGEIGDREKIDVLVDRYIDARAKLGHVDKVIDAGIAS